MVHITRIPVRAHSTPEVAAGDAGARGAFRRRNDRAIRLRQTRAQRCGSESGEWRVTSTAHRERAHRVCVLFWRALSPWPGKNATAFEHLANPRSPSRLYRGIPPPGCRAPQRFAEATRETSPGTNSGGLSGDDAGASSRRSLSGALALRLRHLRPREQPRVSSTGDAPMRRSAWGWEPLPTSEGAGFRFGEPCSVSIIGPADKVRRSRSVSRQRREGRAIAVSENEGPPHWPASLGSEIGTGNGKQVASACGHWIVLWRLRRQPIPIAWVLDPDGARRRLRRGAKCVSSCSCNSGLARARNWNQRKVGGRFAERPTAQGLGAIGSLSASGAAGSILSEHFGSRQRCTASFPTTGGCRCDRTSPHRLRVWGRGAP